MYNYQIDDELKNFKCFQGTFAKNTLPLKIYSERPIAFIINTQNIEEPGEHWVALFVNENNVAEYFDSFGFGPICCRIEKLCKLNGIRTLLINKNCLQNIFSNSCGKFCILFIKYRCNNKTFKEFLSKFTENTFTNEIAIQNLV